MSDSAKTQRHQIAEAMEKIRHQLELLRAGPALGEPADDRGLIAELEAEYRALDQARANLP